MSQIGLVPPLPSPWFELLRALLPPQQQEPPGSSLTDWIVAVTSVATVIAAGVAGWYARRAAIWTGQQAASSDEQVTLARDSLAEAKEQTATAQEVADLQRDEIRRAERRLEEARYDAAMPAVYARATPGMYGAAAVQLGVSKDGLIRWEPVMGSVTIRRPDTGLLVRRSVSIHVTNYSTQLAKVSVLELGAGEASIPQSDVLVVGPNQTEKFTWTHVSNIDRLTAEGLEDPELSRVSMTLWIRDNALTTYDVVTFNIGFRAFAWVDGRLVVEQLSDSVASGIDWGGWPQDGRVYDVLDAKKRGAGTAS